MKIFSVLLITFILSGCAGFWPFGEKDSFIKVDGTHFVRGGHPYYFAGTNMWYAGYLGSPGRTGDRPRLLRELDSLHALGLDNIRIMAGSETSERNHVVIPSITVSPGVVDDTLLQGLDFALAEMAKRKMKAVLYLTNYREWSGGMSQYLSWADSIKSFDPEVEGWGTFMDFSARFYKNERANEMYREYVKSIITRENSVNGRFYSEDPAIMSWQLANEPRPGRENKEGIANLPYFYRWIEQAGAYIKSLDTNHLVSTGNEGMAGCLQNEENFLRAHSSGVIDYVTIHVWPFNWKWYDPKEFESTLPVAIANSKEYIAKHIDLARRLHKPMVMEEFGLGRDNGGYSPAAPVTARDRYYSAVLQMVYDSAKSGTPVAGSNFWGWGGEGKAANPDFIWKEGDPFTGDPPQEPQGINSIFNSDSTTIAVITSFAKQMKRLGNIDTLNVPPRSIDAFHHSSP